MVDPPIKIDNVVAVAMLDVKVPIGKLSSEEDSVENNDSQFEGIVYRPCGLRIASLVYPSGKIICTGARSIEEAKATINTVVKKIRETGVEVPEKIKIEIENIVASWKTGLSINLEEAVTVLEGAEYEPEEFPSLIYRVAESALSFLVFGNGKIICTGGRSLREVRSAFASLMEKLKKAGSGKNPSKGKA